MSRTVAASIAAAFAQTDVLPLAAIEAFFDSGTIRLWTGTGDRVLAGNTYSGVGDLLTINPVSEKSKMEAVGASITLSGIPSSLISLALTEPYQGRECKIHVGVDGSTDLVNVFSGLIDQMLIHEAGETTTIVLTVESHLVKLDRPNPRRYTNESQQARYPGDIAFQFVNDLQDATIVWGKAGNGTLKASSI